jgi:hypothetical protein
MTGARWWLPATIALAVLVVLPAVPASLQDDDHPILAIVSGSTLREFWPSRLDVFTWLDGRAERTRRMVDFGLYPWWTPPELRVAWWRPLSALTHGLDHALWRHRPALMRLHSFVWLAALLVAAFVTYRRIGGPTAAGLAVLFYAVDRTHAFPVIEINARNAIIGALLAVLTLWLHDRWRRGGWRGGAVAAPACFGVALLGAESAVAGVGYLLAHAACLDRGPLTGRLRALLPYALVLAAWRVIYVGLGYGVAHAAPVYMDPTTEPLRFASAVLLRAPFMLLAEWGGPEARQFGYIAGWVALLAWSLAMALLIGLAAVLASTVRRDAVARFWALGHVLAVVPVCAGTGPDDRYLLLVAFGAMGLLGRFLWIVVAREPGWPERAPHRWTVAAGAAVLVVLHLVVSPWQLFTAAVERAAQPAIASGIPDHPRLAEQTLVFVNTPPRVGLYWLFVRAAQEEPIPARTRILTHGLPRMRIERVDASAVRVRWFGEHGFHGADGAPGRWRRVQLAGTEVEVIAMGDHPWPTEAIFRFDRVLDGPDVRWVIWDRARGRFVPFRPPASGEVVDVE